MSDRNSRRYTKKLQTKQAQAQAAHGSKKMEVAVIHGPMTEGQKAVVRDSGHHSIEAYRVMLYRLRFTEGAKRLLWSVDDWRVGLPPLATVWFVEPEHFLGMRAGGLDAIEQVRQEHRITKRRDNGGHAGSVLVFLQKNEVQGTGGRNQVEFIFEHDSLDVQERYVFRGPDSWQGYTRAKTSDPWAEVPLSGEDA